MEFRQILRALEFRLSTRTNPGQQCKRRYSSVTHINGFMRKVISRCMYKYALHFARLHDCARLGTRGVCTFREYLLRSPRNLLQLTYYPCYSLTQCCAIYTCTVRIYIYMYVGVYIARASGLIQRSKMIRRISAVSRKSGRNAMKRGARRRDEMRIAQLSLPRPSKNCRVSRE